MRKVHQTQEWEKEAYVIEWLSKVGERTRRNYTERFPKWLTFIAMSPTEQIQKRFKDLQSTNPKERGYFEDKVVEFKNSLVTQNYKASTIQCTLTPILSLFATHRVPLRFKRKELKVEAKAEDKVVKEWIPENQQVKQIYQHGDIRDRALLLCLYQSGFSETDVSSLSLEDLPDIEKCEGHYPITLHREKTNVLQRTCLSEECVHDIREMIAERRHNNQLVPDANGRTPLFISQKGERLTVRFINDVIKAMVEKTYGAEQANKFKTKSLRDAYNDALLRANLTQELKDTLFGDTRQSSREKYAVSQATIIDAYNKAFQFLSVNHGAQARKDVEELNQKLRSMQNDQNKLVSLLTTMNEHLMEKDKQLEQLSKSVISTDMAIELLTKAIAKTDPKVKEAFKEFLELKREDIAKKKHDADLDVEENRVYEKNVEALTLVNVDTDKKHIEET